MNWDALAAISGVLAAIAVTATVVYLAVEIRHNTRATHSQTYHAATSALAEMAATIGVSKELSRLFSVGMADPEQLDDDEYAQFAYLGISLFRRYENVFFQYQSGMIDEDFWVGHRENLLWFYHRPGIQTWWLERRLAFSKSFREFLEQTSSDEVRSSEHRRI